MNCPNCGNARTQKDGRNKARGDRQMWKCPDCGRRWIEPAARGKGRPPSDDPSPAAIRQRRYAAKKKSGDTP